MTLSVAVGGLGAIGKVLAERLDRGIEGLVLSAVSARDKVRAETAMAGFARPVPVVPLPELGGCADIVVECAPAHLLREIAEPALRHGRLIMVLSCGALLDNFDLVELARRHGGRILVPTGALLGLDAVAAAAEGGISSVHMITRKPPGGLVGAPYLEQHRIDIEKLSEPSESSLAMRARPPAAFRPMSTSLQHWRSPGSGPSAPRSRSGPTPKSPATCTASRSRRTLPASRCRSRMCPRPKIRRRDA